jgi:hypothetical protein
MHATFAQLTHHAEICRQQRRTEVRHLQYIDGVHQSLQQKCQPERQQHPATQHQQDARQQQAGPCVGQRKPRLIEQPQRFHAGTAVQQAGQQHERQRKRQQCRDAWSRHAPATQWVCGFQ